MSVQGRMRSVFVTVYCTGRRDKANVHECSSASLCGLSHKATCNAIHDVPTGSKEHRLNAIIERPHFRTPVLFLFRGGRKGGWQCAGRGHWAERRGGRMGL